MLSTIIQIYLILAYLGQNVECKIFSCTIWYCSISQCIDTEERDISMNQISIEQNTNARTFTDAVMDIRMNNKDKKLKHLVMNVVGISEDFQGVANHRLILCKEVFQTQQMPTTKRARERECMTSPLQEINVGDNICFAIPPSFYVTNNIRDNNEGRLTLRAILKPSITGLRGNLQKFDYVLDASKLELSNVTATCKNGLVGSTVFRIEQNSHDAFIRGGSFRDLNFGEIPEIAVKSNIRKSAERHGLIHFSANEKVQTVSLLLTVADARLSRNTNNELAICRTDESWNERTVMWSNFKSNTER